MISAFIERLFNSASRSSRRRSLSGIRVITGRNSWLFRTIVGLVAPNYLAHNGTKQIVSQLKN
jgi:hypothetical protein